ncbi:MAG: U32 family peptidase [Pseudacidovorax sp.]|uniref:peptidase U32 family protein n=1 Tax=Pseudacidovorax sp. TaxID=1934311 RepID=UPI001B5CEEC5|nr:U32 family peptidase [Pseudacidovorax sp.]MBP6898329.1 U32 family peptidase [Pseudacidovorax sp.]MBP6901064.1 U32 family peptidase [Burkholderiaceae bacterium]
MLRNIARDTLELLAPARDADIGIAAIDHGADAVYIGGPSFGAREKAGNEVADIARLVQHAHRYNARIFVTLNTILRDDELEPARRLAWQLYEAGADALIVQDMGLLQLDLPPLQLHASTQTDIRTPEKARFLQDVGFSQMVLARELTLPQIRAIRAEVRDSVLEFFIHGALCVAYSGLCDISHALTGRSANRGSCSQECRQPYTVADAAGHIIAHDKHVLSLKDNNQSANLAALVEAGIRSFKIEGRYKDVGYVKNVTAHYRRLFDQILDGRRDLRASSSGRCTFFFTPDPERNFNRGTTDYFVNGRKEDIGAFDSPKHAGLALGEVLNIGPEHLDVLLADGVDAVANGDGITWWDLQGELNGVQVNTARALDAAGRRWRLLPNETLAGLKDLKRGTALFRNRDIAWDRTLEKKTAERRIDCDLRLDETGELGAGLVLTLTDEDGHVGQAELAGPLQPARDAARAQAQLQEQLAKLGTTMFAARSLDLALSQPWFVPTAALNALRRDAVAALEAARSAAWQRLPRATPVEPPAPCPERSLSYLANVYNHAARDFYARHGVELIEAAYESHEELGEVSLMVTRHCVRFSLSLCPKQAKGVTGVQGTIRAEPLQLRHGDDVLTLRFDCKPCEMHVVGRMQPHVLKAARAAERAAELAATPAAPLTFYKARPTRV